MDQVKQVKPIEIHPQTLSDIDRVNLTNVDYDTLVQMGIDAGEVKTYSQWILGKVGDAVSVKYSDLTKYANEIHQKPGVLWQYTNTYRKFIKEDPNFTPDKYAGSIPWGVLALAAVKSDKPQELVDELADKGVYSIEGAYREIKTKETGVEVPRKPTIKLNWDTEAKKYKIRLKSEELDLIDWTDVKEQLITYLEALT